MSKSVLSGSSKDFYEKNVLNGYHIDGFTYNTLGKILTVIDASISEPKQNKAIKDLIRDIFSKNKAILQEWVFQNCRGCQTNFPFVIELPPRG